MLQKNFKAHQNQDNASRELRFGFEFDAECVANFDAEYTEEECSSVLLGLQM